MLHTNFFNSDSLYYTLMTAKDIPNSSNEWSDNTDQTDMRLRSDNHGFPVAASTSSTSAFPLASPSTFTVTVSSFPPFPSHIQLT